MKNTGTENYGGPVVTAGGLVFIGATNFDRKFHAYDKATGEAAVGDHAAFAGNATPATYEIDGRQYVVIAAGGGKDPRQNQEGCTWRSRFRARLCPTLGAVCPWWTLYSALSEIQRETAVTTFRDELRTDSATSQFRKSGNDQRLAFQQTAVASASYGLRIHGTKVLK